jgi:hypothetical protein
MTLGSAAPSFQIVINPGDTAFTQALSVNTSGANRPIAETANSSAFAIAERPSPSAF